MGKVIDFNKRKEQRQDIEQLGLSLRVLKIINMFAHYPNHEDLADIVWDVLEEINSPKKLDQVRRFDLCDVAGKVDVYGRAWLMFCCRLDTIMSAEPPEGLFTAPAGETDKISSIMVAHYWETMGNTEGLIFDEDGVHQPTYEIQDAPEELISLILEDYASKFPQYADKTYYTMADMGRMFIREIIVCDFVYISHGPAENDDGVIPGMYIVTFKRGLEVINVVFNLKIMCEQEEWFYTVAQTYSGEGNEDIETEN